MPVTNRIRRVLKDWTFLGAAIVTIALIVSVVLGQTALKTVIVSALGAFLAVFLVLQYATILEILDDTKDIRLELRRLNMARSDVEITKRLSLISLEAFVDREATLESGDSVSVFANTLEVDCQPMFDVVVANLKRGVVYRYLLFENDQADDWEKFIRLLKKHGVKRLPLVKFDPSRIATLLQSSTVIYDFEGHSKAPQGFCVLFMSDALDTCVVMSPEVAAQTRDGGVSPNPRKFRVVYDLSLHRLE